MIDLTIFDNGVISLTMEGEQPAANYQGLTAWIRELPEVAAHWMGAKWGSSPDEELSKAEFCRRIVPEEDLIKALAQVNMDGDAGQEPRRRRRAWALR